MSKELSYLLADISIYLALIPSILGFFRIKSPFVVQRQMVILVWGSTIISLLASFIASVLHKNNLFLLHFYTIFDFVLLTFIFRDVLNKRLFLVLLVGFPVFAAIKSVFFDHLTSENVLNRSTSALIIMFYALSFFTKTLREMKILNLGREPLFWVSVGVLFYNAASFFIFLFSHYLTPIHNLWYTYFGIHAIFTILLYLFYTIALWVQPKQ